MELICPGVLCPAEGCIPAHMVVVGSIESFDWQWIFSRGSFEGGLVLPDSSTFPQAFQYSISNTKKSLILNSALLFFRSQ